MKQIAERLAQLMIEHSWIEEKDRDIYVYGIDIGLYTIISTLGLLLIGLLMGQFVYSLILVFVFYTMQTSGGGYHASTHLNCFISMAVGLVIGLLICRIPDIPALYCLITIMISSVITFVIPLTLHKNRQFSGEKKQSLKLKSRIVILCLFAAGLVLYLFALQGYLLAFSVGMAISCISRLYAFTSEKIRKRAAA